MKKGIQMVKCCPFVCSRIILVITPNGRIKDTYIPFVGLDPYSLTLLLHYLILRFETIIRFNTRHFPIL